MADRRRPRVLVAGMQYELNSFVAGTAGLERFRQFRMAEGDAVFAVAKGEEVDGALRVARTRGVELVPVFLAFGGAGPVLEDGVYDHFRDRILAGVRAHRGAIDAIYLPLHGAMATVSEPDTEGDLITRIRAIVGPDLPIAASFDMHCNFTAGMERGLDAALGFKTCPHVDYVETGMRSLEILADTLAGTIRPRLVHRKLRMMTPAEGHDTNTGPMRDVIAQLRDLETRPGIVAATVIAPQPWMDVPETGWSILVVVDGDANVELGRREADRIARLCWDMRERFLVRRTPLAEALDIAAANPEGAKPVVMTDAADAPSAGSYGDSAVVLEALLARPRMRGPFLMTMTDPAAARACEAAGIGATLRLRFGGAFQPAFFKPVDVEATVRDLIRAPYESQLPPGTIDPGLRAVVEIAGFVRMVIAERQMATLDLRPYESSGLDPRRAQAVLVKSAGQFRGFYTAIAARILELDTPGPVNGILTQLPFRHLTRPLWPFDADLAAPW
ncbi:MAG: M81 family metallopeptidase [Alphaproteobacteria bacterium]|nr:M81 family metallopeptidase [Alphaproteobacteria bacterium]